MPSLTEALFALGLGDRVVGVTDWCVHPADGVAPLPKVGGTKDANVAAIVALAPDLVIANHEENTPPRRSSGSRRRGSRVWVTYPRTVRGGRGAAARARGARRDRPRRSRRVVEPVEAAVAAAERARPRTPRARLLPDLARPLDGGRPRHLHPLDARRSAAARNVFADRGDRRYPIVTLDDVVAAAPEVILLPDEPYAFGAADVAELGACRRPRRAQRTDPLIDGTWVSWYGPRIERALRAIRSLLAADAC